MLVGLMCAMVAVSTMTAAAEEVSSLEFYVAPDGHDSNPGTCEAPFATIQQAQARVRDQDKSTLNGITVSIYGGTYYLTEPVTFGHEDSGSVKTPIVYRAYRDEIPVISGGVALEVAWKPFRDGIMMAEAPGAYLDIDELYVDGQRQHMARYPNFDHEAHFFGGTSGNAIARKRVRSWADPTGGFVHALHESMWGSKHYRIVGVEKGGRLKLQGGWQENRGGGFDDHYRGGFHRDHLFAENIFEELDAPGEWYLDKKKKTLYLMPSPGVDLSSAEILGAGLLELFVIQGSEDKPVSHLTFQDLHFKHTRRVFMEPYERLLRGDWSIARRAAVRFECATDCAVKDCYFDDLGGNCVLLSRYNRRVNVTGSRFTRFGESGVCLVGDVGAVRSPAIEYGTTLPQDTIDLTPGPQSPNYPSQCTVHDNLIFRFGYVGKQVAAVFISMSEEITVSHNTIYQCPRAAICINDGCWGGHVIEYNDAFNTVRESGDHGPFNSWGRSRFWKTSYNGGRDIEPFAKERALLDNRKETHIRHNRFAHPGGHSWGIDLDDGSSNYCVYNNLCLGMGIKFREGFFRRAENNIIVDGFGGFHIWLPGCDDVIARNIFVSDKPYQFIRANPEYAKEIDYNLFWNRGEEITITGVGEDMSLAAWQAKEFDTHSVAADPQFIDPENGDYRVKPESPARKLGFKNFAMTSFGVEKAAFKREVAKEPRKYGLTAAGTGSKPGRSAARVSWMGATIKNLTGEAEKSAAGMGAETGVLLVEVPADSAAAKAGYSTGDVILQFGAAPVDTLSDLQHLLKANVGKEVPVAVFNATKRTLMLDVDSQVMQLPLPTD